MRRMKSYLLVGAGQLGSRHLQALAALPDAHAIYVVEPYHPARETALARFKQVTGHEEKRLVFADMAELKKQNASIDAAIIATLSPNRVSVLSGVLDLGVRYILCEKILFQSVAEYKEALALVAARKARVHVNHTNRYFPVYSEIRDWLKKHRLPLSIRLSAGNVGMGCNLIHELDTLEFLTGRKFDQLEVTIDRPLLPCKRGTGLVEFTGTARASTPFGDSFEAAYAPGSSSLPEMTLQYGDHVTLVSQEKNEWSPQGGKPQPLGMPFVSQLTARLMPEIFAGTTLMPTIEDTFSINRLMLDEFNRLLHETHDDRTLCPIT